MIVIFLNSDLVSICLKHEDIKEMPGMYPIICYASLFTCSAINPGMYSHAQWKQICISRTLTSCHYYLASDTTEIGKKLQKERKTGYLKSLYLEKKSSVEKEGLKNRSIAKVKQSRSKHNLIFFCI